MGISDEEFRALVTLIEDGEVDDKMVELIAAVDDRNERRKTEIERLVQSVWGPDAKVVGGRSTAPVSAPAKADTEVPDGHYLAQNGNVYPLPSEAQAEQPPAARSPWPPAIQAQTEAGDPVIGISPVRDPMGGNMGDGNPDIVSTGAQIGRYQG